MKPNSISRGLNAARREVEIRWRVSGFLTPSANDRLSNAEFDRARSICSDIRAIISARTGYIDENGLDTEFCFPGANWEGDWEENPLYRGTVALLREDYEVINNLRLFSQVFSGYSLLEMKDARGLLVPDHVPLDLTERLIRVSRRTDDWVRRYWVLSRCVPGFLHLSQPNRFGEAGWIYSGRIVNHDTCVYMERVALLHASGLLNRLGATTHNPLILEIGGGFGGLAYHLKRLVPQARYIIIDIPESLVFSAIYLTTLFPDQHNVMATSPELMIKFLDRPGFTFIPNHFCHRFEDAGKCVDLAINTLSMSEMLAGQVAAYCELVRNCLRPEGVFFEQNEDNRHLGLLNAELQVGAFFKHRRQISLPTYLVSGSPNIWSQ